MNANAVRNLNGFSACLVTRQRSMLTCIPRLRLGTWMTCALPSPEVMTSAEWCQSALLRLRAAWGRGELIIHLLLRDVIFQMAPGPVRASYATGNLHVGRMVAGHPGGEAGLTTLCGKSSSDALSPLLRCKAVGRPSSRMAEAARRLTNPGFRRCSAGPGTMISLPAVLASSKFR